MSEAPQRRLRFAPSPTGSLHVGNARTALINWIVARQRNGTLVLRIEDTDVERSEAANEATILEDLAWLGIDWNEGPGVGGDHEIGGDRGPYRQSERRDLYDDAKRQLLEAGAIYPAFESAEEIESRRQAAKARGESFCYRGEHRDVSPAQAVALAGQGGAALRFKVPDRDVRFVDRRRGDTGLAAGEIGDFVVFRADGSPTYNLAVVVDDHLMAVTDVIRGADHLTNTPRQLLLYEALGWTPPRFAHLPLVLGPDRSRLSKRHGATSVAEMRAAGILPEALCNFLALLGWSPPEGREVLAIHELLAEFDLDKLSPTNAVFDVTKLEWLNGQHIAGLSPADLLDRAAAYLGEGGIAVPAGAEARAWFAEFLALVSIGCRRLTELSGSLGELLHPNLEEMAAAAADELDTAEARAVAAAFARASRAGELADEAAYLATVERVKESTGARGRGLFHPLRWAISGQESGPEVKRLVPLLEAGSGVSPEPPVSGVAERIDAVLAALGAASG